MSLPRLVSLDIAKGWAQDSIRWSPRQLLAGDASHFPSSLRMSVKRSLTSRFFMYEEYMDDRKLRDEHGPTEVLDRSPLELADLLHENKEGHYYYWTSPIRDVAPGLMEEKWMKGLLEEVHGRRLDPRGPSLWMGSSRSGTQAHYDVADNVIVQLSGVKRIRCFPPKAAQALHVFPDAHPRARKSQVDFDQPNLDLFPNFSTLSQQQPIIDVNLLPGDALYIPAFWFHHVENGMDYPQQPSVSMNLFALSTFMIKAQKIFTDASQPFPNSLSIHPLLALHALSYRLLNKLVVQCDCSPTEFIQTFLIDTRYAPLQKQNPAISSTTSHFGSIDKKQVLTNTEDEIVSKCVSQLIPQLQALCDDEDDNGVYSLVLCHLLELWAVELLGASAVPSAWEQIIHLK